MQYEVNSLPNKFGSSFGQFDILVDSMKEHKLDISVKVNDQIQLLKNEFHSEIDSLSETISKWK